MSEENTPGLASEGGLSSTDLFAVLDPVMDWYQPEEDEPRDPLDIVRDIVADLQADRADSLQLRNAMQSIRDTAIAMRDSMKTLPPKGGSVLIYEAPERIRARACESLANSNIKES